MVLFFIPQNPTRVLRIHFLLDTYTSSTACRSSRLSVCLTSIVLPVRKDNIINLNYVTSKSSHEEVMWININFIILSRAAFPREKGVFLTLLSWDFSWPQLGKTLPHNYLFWGEWVFKAEDPWGKGLVPYSRQWGMQRFSWFPTDTVSTVTLDGSPILVHCTRSVDMPFTTLDSPLKVRILHAKVSAAS